MRYCVIYFFFYSLLWGIKNAGFYVSTFCNTMFSTWSWVICSANYAPSLSPYLYEETAEREYYLPL